MDRYSPTRKELYNEFIRFCYNALIGQENQATKPPVIIANTNEPRPLDAYLSVLITALKIEGTPIRQDSLVKEKETFYTINKFQSVVNFSVQSYRDQEGSMLETLAAFQFSQDYAVFSQNAIMRLKSQSQIKDISMLISSSTQIEQRLQMDFEFYFETQFATKINTINKITIDEIKEEGKK